MSAINHNLSLPHLTPALCRPTPLLGIVSITSLVTSVALIAFGFLVAGIAFAVAATGLLILRAIHLPPKNSSLPLPASLSLTQSPYSRLMIDDLIQLISQHLGFAESVSKLPALNRQHRNLFQSKGFRWEKIMIHGSFAYYLFKNIAKFQRLQILNIHFSYIYKFNGMNWQANTYGGAAITTPTICRTLTALNISLAHHNVSLLCLHSLLQRIPFLQKLDFTPNRVGDPVYIQSAATGSIETMTEENLRDLIDLESEPPIIQGRALLQNVESSRSSRTIFFSIPDPEVTNAIFNELALKETLIHLNLSWYSRLNSDDRINYQRLAGCRNLESFVAISHMSEDTLLSILVANPHIISLDLSDWKPLNSNNVLQIIAAKIPALRTFQLFKTAELEFPNEGFKILVQSCTHLQKFVLTANEHSEEGLSELKNCQELEELSIHGQITEIVLENIVTIPSLKFLLLNPYIPGQLSESSLLGIQQLRQLEFLDLGQTQHVTPQFITAIANHCPQLQTLKMNCQDEETLIAVLNSIKVAMTENRFMKLSILSSGYKGIDRSAIIAFRQDHPRIQLD